MIIAPFFVLMLVDEINDYLRVMLRMSWNNREMPRGLEYMMP
jgi:hypothetical protein